MSARLSGLPRDGSGASSILLSPVIRTDVINRVLIDTTHRTERVFGVASSSRNVLVSFLCLNARQAALLVFAAAPTWASPIPSELHLFPG
jgi:hypothetical protein